MTVEIMGAYFNFCLLYGFEPSFTGLKGFRKLVQGGCISLETSLWKWDNVEVRLNVRFS